MVTEDGKSSIWISVVITFLIMLIIGGVGYYLLDKKNREDKAALESQVASLTEQVSALNDATEAESTKEESSDKETATQENPWLYKNTTYGFSLTFNSKWEGYKLKLADISGSTATYYVCVPTTDADWIGTEAYPGTASIFAISVYSKAQWASITAEEPVMTTKLGETSKYVFGYSQAQSAPTDIQNKGLFSDVKNIVATFDTL